MCYSARDSIVAYGINLVACTMLFFFAKDNQFKVLALFLLFVGQMQIFDYYFWNHQTCDKSNNIATKLAIAVNHYQPSVFFLLQKFFGFKQSLESLVILGIYTLFSFLYNTKALKDIDCTLPKDGVLEWRWTNLEGSILFYSLFILYLVVASFNFTSWPVKITAALASIITYAVASKKIFMNIHEGRAWCYYASFMPFLFLGLNFIS